MTRAGAWLLVGGSLLVPCTAHADGEGVQNDFPLPDVWPPQKGQPYPDVELLDHEGQPVKISDFRGKVVLVEPIGMNCPGCQAFVGGNGPRGPYGGGRPQSGIKSIEELLTQYGKAKLSDRRLVYVHLLIYDMSNSKAPTQEDARAWAEHWEIPKRKNAFVLWANQNYINQASWNLIPGFQLIDKHGVLRSDSSGHHPQDNLYDTLLPMVKTLLKERGPRPQRRSDATESEGEEAPEAAAEAPAGESDPKAKGLIELARNYAANGAKSSARRKLEEAKSLQLSDADRAEVERLLEELE
jgi:hypothetical protein